MKVPENAYRKLQEGETYKPNVPTEDKRAEVTVWSIGIGAVLTALFTGACVYIALRAGNGIEAAVPIALLAIFISKTKTPDKRSILENVMVQSVGQASGVVAAGATFVIPALYINQLQPAWWHIFFACAIGASLGVVLIIPMRQYFVKEQHGAFPFPEATAINEVLVSGERADTGAGKILILAFLLGAGFDFLVEGISAWNSDLNTSLLPWGIGERLGAMRIEVQIAGIAALFGLGFLIGLKYASIIAAGSILAFVVMVPLVYLFGSQMETFHYIGKDFHVATMGPGQIFGTFIKPIGIGAIAFAGLYSIIKLRKTVKDGIVLGLKGLKKKGGAAAATERTDMDMSPRNVLLIQLAATLAMGVLFFVVAMITPQANGASYGFKASATFAVVGMVAGYLLSFLFTPVAAQAIAIMGVNPVSGMTLIAVVIAIGALTLAKLGGNAGMIVALIVGTAICTALSTSGAFISDLKVGYWIGSTPRNQQRWKFLGILIAALVVSVVIPLMDQAYQFTILDPTTGLMVANDKVLPAPQANMIAAVAKGLMDNPANQPWLLYGLGGIMTTLLVMAGIPALAFALGMYLPLGINMAVLAGAVCAVIIGKTGKSDDVRKARSEQVHLIAAGLMAGAALLGIGTAFLRLPGIGAPIRHISVGVDYELVAIVDGAPILRDGKPVEYCAEAVIPPGKSCNEQLVPQPYRVDADKKPMLDKQGRPILAHPWYEEKTGRVIGLLMLILLGFACYTLARKGAKWQMRAEAEEHKDTPTGTGTATQSGAG